MKRFLLASAFSFAFILPAFAVTITFSVGATSFTTTVTAPNAARFATWAAAQYPTIPNPSYVTPCGSPLPACLPLTIPNPTPGVSALGALYQGTVNNILSWEKSQSVAAVPDPSPVN